MIYKLALGHSCKKRSIVLTRLCMGNASKNVHTKSSLYIDPISIIDLRNENLLSMHVIVHITRILQVTRICRNARVHVAALL